MMYRSYLPRSIIPKYQNRKTVYKGIEYDSKKEANYAATLDIYVRSGDIESWTPKPIYNLKINGKLICKHIPDFAVIRNGDLEVHEVKSPATKTGVWKIKKKLFEALYPTIPYIVIE